MAKILELKEETVELLKESSNPQELFKKRMEKMREANPLFGQKNNKNGFERNATDQIIEGMTSIIRSLVGVADALEEIKKDLSVIMRKEFKATTSFGPQEREKMNKETELLTLINNKIGKIMDDLS